MDTHSSTVTQSYRVDQLKARGITEYRFNVRGASPEEAATIAARKLYGRRAVALRATGATGLSGYFQAYRPVLGDGLSSIGRPYHVW